ncbi:hypothetical protein C8R44DRAFT_736290 [Mycena epipterygia]|nr:hypothetical protein C8R44DRAFT_736290 [Mycena epipterygia]
MTLVWNLLLSSAHCRKKRQLDTTCSDILACSERPEKRLRIVDGISLQCENRDLEMTNPDLEILMRTDPWPTVVYASYTFMADEPMPEVESPITSESPASWTEQRHIEYLGTLVPRLKTPCHYFTGQPGELTEFYRQFKWREETRSWYLNVSAEGWMTDTEWKRVYEDPIVCASLPWRNSEFWIDEESLREKYERDGEPWEMTRERFRIRWIRPIQDRHIGEYGNLPVYLESRRTRSLNEGIHLKPPVIIRIATNELPKACQTMRYNCKGAHHVSRAHARQVGHEMVVLLDLHLEFNNGGMIRPRRGELPQIKILRRRFVGAIVEREIHDRIGLLRTDMSEAKVLRRREMLTRVAGEIERARGMREPIRDALASRNAQRLQPNRHRGMLMDEPEDLGRELGTVKL